MKRIRSSVARSRASRGSPVGAQERAARSPSSSSWLTDEVREVEERVAHPRVLPVDDPQPLSVVDEVRVEQVVVARPRRLAAPEPLDPPRRRVRGGERGGEHVAPRATAASRYASTTSSASKRPGIGGPSWHGAHGRARRASSCAGSRSASGLGIVPSTKRVTSQPSGSTNVDDLRADADRGRGLGRGALDLRGRSRAASVSRPAIRSTKTPSGRVTLTLWFVIPPPRTSQRDVAVRPDARDRRREGVAHARIRSPAGSKSGSSATTPGTQSPKISTATSVPTSCSSGQVGERDRRADGVAVAAARHAADERLADTNGLRAERDRTGLGEDEAAQQPLGLGRGERVAADERPLVGLRPRTRAPPRRACPRG